MFSTFRKSRTYLWREGQEMGGLAGSAVSALAKAVVRGCGTV
jgi:hypothetical protein